MSKRKIILLLLLSIMILPKVDAEISINLTDDWSKKIINDSSSSGNSSTESTPILTYKDNNGTDASDTNNKIKYIDNDNYACTYNGEINLINNIVIDAIDNNNNTILENNKTTTSKEVTAGTWVGINAYETVTSIWTVANFKFYKKQTIYECTYTTSYLIQDTDVASVQSESVCTFYCENKYPTIKDDEVKWNSYLHKCTCNYYKTLNYTTTFKKQGDSNITDGASFCGNTYNGYRYSSMQSIEDIYIQSNNDEKNKYCMQEVIDQYNEKANNNVNKTTTKLIYLDPNDYTDSDGKIKEYDTSDTNYKIETTLNCNINKCKDSQVQVGNATEYSGTASKTYEYIINHVCLNTKTGKVTYKNSKCDEKTELQVSNININNKNYWHYFIPMGMTSDSQFYLKILQQDSTKLNKKQCKNLIDDYNDINSTTYYRNIMQPLNNTWKDESLYKDDEARKKADKKLVEDSDGCEIISTISFDVFQDFYKEEVDTSGKVTGFNGFKFYFRQININNPFPNGIADNSYWKDWESDKTNPNLAKSFDKITYSAFNLDLESIRAFNKENAYTSWENMKKDGSSNFVKENVSSSNNNTYYALGGGPKTTISNNSVKYNAGGDG